MYLCHSCAFGLFGHVANITFLKYFALTVWPHIFIVPSLFYIVKCNQRKIAHCRKYRPIFFYDGVYIISIIIFFAFAIVILSLFIYFQVSNLQFSCIIYTYTLTSSFLYYFTFNFFPILIFVR
jgi:hypothetical protein